MIKWIGLITIISCLTINLITGQLPFIDQKSPNIEIQQQLTDKDQIGLKTAPSFAVNNVNGINQIKTDQLPANQQQQLININPVTQSSKSDSIKLQTSVQQQSNQVEIKSQSKDDGEYKTLEEILSLAGLANVDALVPSSDPKSFLIKTRTKTTEDKEEDDEKEEKEEKEVKKTTKKKSKKKSTKKSSKKSSKKSKKKSKKKKKKKKSCGCCCCCK